ncbi:MAG: GNAT family N-acetyltransferase [Bacteroidota bacterium]
MVETNRLILKPLTGDQLQKYLRNDHSLEKELGLEYIDRMISPELKEALEQTIIPGVAGPGRNYFFSTLWTLISRAENRMVGDLCFMGEPNEEGDIEIGYGIYESERGKGYMTEAVGGMIRWAGTQPTVEAIVASTDRDNPASAAILVRNGFDLSGEKGPLLHWRLKIR